MDLALDLTTHARDLGTTPPLTEGASPKYRVYFGQSASLAAASLSSRSS
jgi:hypothetical protein